MKVKKLSLVLLLMIYESLRAKIRSINRTRKIARKITQTDQSLRSYLKAIPNNFLIF